MGSATNTLRSMEVAANGSFALRAQTATWVKKLTANTAAAVTLPTGCSHVSFAANGDFWANYDVALAAVPSVDIVDGTAPEINPTVRLVTGVTTINLIAPADTLLSIMFFGG